MDVSASLMNNAAGFISVALFVFAWIMNQNFRGHNWSVIPVMVVCLLGSFVLYASTWAPTVAGWTGNILGGITSIFGADMSSLALRMLFSLACLLAVLAIVADCVVDPGYNQAAVWALIIAPITAHGAGGVVGRAFEGLYTAMSLGTLGGLIELLGN